MTEVLRFEGSHGDEEWGGSFTFVQAADTQLGFMADPTWDDPGGDGSVWEEEIALAERMVRCVNALRPAPRFVVVCGDLVHALPPGLKKAHEGGNPSADRYSNTDFWKRQNADFKRIMSKLTVPLVCVCGNHDVGDRPTPESIAQYESQHGRHYFGFWCGGVRGLVINAQLFADASHAPDIHREQVGWFLEELKELTDGKSKHKKHAVLFQHIPWFLRHESEPPEGYFNLPPAVRTEWLSRLKAAGVSKVFCGHYHRNAGAMTDDGRLEVVVTSAVGRQMSAEECKRNKSLKGTPDGESGTKSGFRLVKVHERGIDHEYKEFDALERALGLNTACAWKQKKLLCLAGASAVALAAFLCLYGSQRRSSMYSRKRLV